MALDGLFLYSIKEELQSLIGCKVDKINQPEKDEVILTIRGNKTTRKLLISASANYPRVHFTNNSKQNPLKAPMFCMILRKYLSSAKIIEINQLDFDRIMKIDFENVDELGFDSKYALIIEIMGRHSNITLIRERDNIIMDSIKHITSDINTYRSIYPGLKYVFPPKSEKLNPLNFNFEELNDYIKNQEILSSETLFSKIFTGISSGLSKELYYELTKSKENLSTNSVYDFSLDFFNKIKNSEFVFSYYLDELGNLKDFHCVELLKLKSNCNSKKYLSPSNLLEDFYFEKDKLDRLKNKSADLKKLLHINIERCNKKIAILNDTLEKCTHKDDFRLYGELLTANIYKLKKGDTKISLLNYYSQTEEFINITLNPNKTPSENVQFYFKKYNKLKTSEEMGIIQLKSTKEELDYLLSVVTNIDNADNYDEIGDIKNELIETGYIKFKTSYKKKKKKESKPLHFVSSDGADIYVGKNNLQNDYLTLKFAKKNDIWLHTKEVHGSHVIIKNEGANVSDKTLEEAASLAAYYSKGKNSTKVAVDYTEVKNVKKPSGAKPGMVIYYTYKTIIIEPKNINSK
ncbi:NFACT family protein [Haloimpatiens sp. FM7315]|uniref:Rqc2 family fibronectin-binding protein n=1 Tax=Haloimpatiens sp. FM7315 TaxID=3298609 RepID=UPI00370B52C1